jgi:hypothetical protein
VICLKKKKISKSEFEVAGIDGECEIQRRRKKTEKEKKKEMIVRFPLSV